MKKNYKNKLLRYRMFFFLYAACLGGGLSCLYNYKTGEEVAVSVPEDLRRELYDRNIINENEASKTDTNEDKYITENVLSRLTEITLHASKIDDFDIINKIPNLEKLGIENPEFLTDEDIEKINNSQVNAVVLYFNLYNVEQTRENKFDLSRITKPVFIANGSNYNTDDFVWKSELYDLVLFNYLQNYSKDMFINQDYYHYYTDLNNRLDKIIENNHMDEISDLEERLYTISKYICKKIKYDSEISELTDNYSSSEASKEELDKISEYNRYSISCIINNIGTSTNINGICSNYADLFDILCYKLDIKTRVLNGGYSDDGWGHRWNTIYNNGEVKYVDLTLLDGTIPQKVTIIDPIEGTIKTKNAFTRKNFDKYFYNDIEEYLEKHLNFTVYDDTENLDKELEKEDTIYYNTQIDGEEVHNKPVNIPMALLIGASSGLASIWYMNKVDNLSEVLVKKIQNKKRS